MFPVRYDNYQSFVLNKRTMDNVQNYGRNIFLLM
jgi:hypothetical protein